MLKRFDYFFFRRRPYQLLTDSIPNLAENQLVVVRAPADSEARIL
jgi:hypothetical protein